MDQLNPPPAPAAKLVPIGSSSRARAHQVVEDQRKFRPHVYWYLSFRCNLACKHCSVFSSPWVDTSDDLQTEDCMRVVDQMADLGVGCAILTGGEVLLRPDATKIIARLGERGIPIGLETNGLRFDSEFVQLARKLQERRMLQITVSLDGGTAETHEKLRGPHSFHRTVKGLRLLAAEGVKFHIQCVLNRANRKTVPQLYDLAQELSPQLRMLQFALLNPVGRGIELTDEIGLSSENVHEIFESIAQHKSRFEGSTLIKGPPAVVPPKHLGLVFQSDGIRKSVSCQFPLLGVLPNGDITICAVSRDNQELHYGNIRDTELQKVWQETRMDMLRSRYVSAEHLNGICGDCVWKFTCKGGCRAWAYEDGGSFDAPLPICKQMADAGDFPKAYRISLQNDAMVRSYQQMQGGCACH